MKELFNSLSNTDNFTREARLVFKQGPEGPKPIDYFNQEGFEKVGKRRIQKKEAFKLSAKAPKAAMKKADSLIKKTSFEKKGSKPSNSNEMKFETMEINRTSEKVARMAKEVNKKLDRMQSNGKTTELANYIFKKAKSTIDSGDLSKINALSKMVDRINFSYKQVKGNTNWDTFRARMQRDVDSTLNRLG